MTLLELDNIRRLCLVSIDQLEWIYFPEHRIDRCSLMRRIRDDHVLQLVWNEINHWIDGGLKPYLEMIPADLCPVEQFASVSSCAWRDVLGLPKSRVILKFQDLRWPFHQERFNNSFGLHEQIKGFFGPLPEELN